MSKKRSASTNSLIQWCPKLWKIIGNFFLVRNFCLKMQNLGLKTSILGNVETKLKF